MEFLKPSRHKTLLSETVYILLNILVAAAILVVVLVVESPLPAFLLVLLSKWRILAVRPQYWPAHVVANAVDIIVSLGLVVFLYAASGHLSVQIILTVLYVAWLLFLKPSSKRTFVVLQAGVSVFVGVAALMHVAFEWWDIAVVAIMWMIGYASARHVLTAYNEPHFVLLSLVWGTVFAELGWLFYHWSFGYRLSVLGDLQISQAAVVMMLLSFLAERVYNSYHRNKEIKLAEVILPALLVISSIVLLLTLFGTVKTI